MAHRQPWRPLAAALLLAMAAVGAAAAAGAAPRAAPPAQGGSAAPGCAPYCSLNAVTPFYGDVSSSGGLRAALAARAFARQLILLPADARRLESALAGAASLRRLGLGHVLFVSTDPLTCRAVRRGWWWPRWCGGGWGGAQALGLPRAWPAAGSSRQRGGDPGRTAPVLTPPVSPSAPGPPCQVEKLEPSLGCVWQERRGEPADWTPLTRLYQAKERLTLR
jgi:hypothetical protein